MILFSRQKLRRDFMKPSYEGAKFCLVFLMGMLIFSISGCGGDSSPARAPLSAANINLIFVVSPDLADDPLGDINPTTANLSNQGLQRSLLMATYLKQKLLGANNVSGIYTLEPMTHLQTANNYPDMAAIGFIQQFALLNQYTVQGVTADSYPIYAAYAPGDVPAGVATPSPFVPAAQGLAFNDANGNNVALVTRIIDANVPGFYVFSAPWETTSALLANIKTSRGDDLDLPTTYMGPNLVYVISVKPSGKAGLLAFDSRLTPPDTYPVLPSPVESASCTQQDYFSCTRTGGVNGAAIPPRINTNQTVYMIRHAEAHPSSAFEDGNFVGAGQWRALSLPNFLPGALRGQNTPTRVYSVDPAQSFPVYNVSYVRPSLTVLPYAIANNLPYYLAAGFLMDPNANSDTAAENAKNFFFTNTAGVNLSNQTILLAWEHKHFPLLIKHLLQSYGGSVPAPTLSWPDDDYDTIWAVTLDAKGNVTVNNALCEGIDSTKLPAAPPQF
jgi:hypothetical protein